MGLNEGKTINIYIIGALGMNRKGAWGQQSGLMSRE